MKNTDDCRENDADSQQSMSIAESLLLRVRAKDPKAWQKLIEMYGPVVYGWCRRAGLNAEDAADVGQEVFRGVATSIERFRREQQGDTFRGWLFRIAQFKITDFWRRRERESPAVGGTNFQKLLAQIAEEESLLSATTIKPPSQGGEFHRALESIRAEFEDKTWRAFWNVTVDGQSPADVADELGMSRTAVYIAKSRVLKRLRSEFGDLVDL